MKLKCIIVDDEPSGRKVLQEFAGDVDFLELCGTAENPVKALALLDKEPVDLMFLDIQMPRMNGIDFLRSLRQPPLVVLTTAYPEFALQGFELDVTDYLLKPISWERFLKACQKAREFHNLKKQPQPAADFFFIKCNHIYEKIQYDDIYFVEAAENFVYIQTSRKKFISWLTLRQVEESLPAGRFIRTHRSYLVSLSKIDRVDGNEIKAGPYSIPISKNMKTTVLEKLLNPRLLKR